MASTNARNWRYPNTVPAGVREKVLDLLILEEEIEEWEKKARVKEQELMVLRSELKTMREERAEIEEELAEFRIVDSDDQQAVGSKTQDESFINRLPNEMLLLIFEKFLSFRHNRIRSLLLVCRRWNELVLESPSLWAKIELKSMEKLIEAPQDSAEWRYVRACQERSQGLLLDIILDFEEFPDKVSYVVDKMEEVLGNVLDEESLGIVTDDLYENGAVQDLDNSLYDQKLIKFFGILCGENREGMARWKSLDLNIDEITKGYTVWEELYGKNPHLKSLKLTLPSDFFGYEGSDRFPPGGFPDFGAVTRLDCRAQSCLKQLGLSPTSLRYLSLEYERISDLSLDALNNFVLLEELRLQYIGDDPSRRRIQSWKQPPKICLPALESLTLESMSSDFHTLEWQCPTLKTLQVIPHWPREWLPALSVQHFRWSRSRQSGRGWKDANFHEVFNHLMQDLVSVYECTIPSMVRQEFLEKIVDDRKTHGKLASLSIVNVEYPNGRIERIDAEDAGQASKTMPPFPLK